MTIEVLPKISYHGCILRLFYIIKFYLAVWGSKSIFVDPPASILKLKISYSAASTPTALPYNFSISPLHSPNFSISLLQFIQFFDNPVQLHLDFWNHRIVLDKIFDLCSHWMVLLKHSYSNHTLNFIANYPDSYQIFNK